MCIRDSLSGLYQKSKAFSNQGVPGKQNTIVVLSADLFPTKLMFEKAQAYKTGVEHTEGMTNAVQWMLRSQRHNTVIVLLDGNSRQVRKAFENTLEDHASDSSRFVEIAITYDQPAKADIRFPQKRYFASFFNRETIFALLPVPKRQFQTRDRSHYSACGEDKTHTMSYSKAEIRKLSSMPHIALNSVGDISGLTAPVQEAKVVKFAGSKGIPLFLSLIHI